MVKLPKIILASGSPRRSEILGSVGWEFTKHVADIDETERPDEEAAQYVERLAREKAEKVAAEHPGEIVLGADTTVVVDGQIVGKPVDLADAKRMLRMLSGRTHYVMTGVAIVRGGVTSSAVEQTSVSFAAMSESEIEFLAEMGEPLDKAGAYAVQAQAALFIKGIEGDYWNVVGLPISTVYKLIMRSAASSAADRIG